MNPGKRSGVLGLLPPHLASADATRGVSYEDMHAIGFVVEHLFVQQRAARDARAGVVIEQTDASIRDCVMKLSRDRSKTGCALTLLTITATLSDDPADWMFRATRMLGGHALPEHAAEEFIDAMRDHNAKRARTILALARQYSIARRRVA